MGWISPYVVKDECTVTIKSAAKTGQTLIIPAKESTYNKSAFDEYFMIELFTKDGNNAKFSDEWNNVFYSGEYNCGVRLYHVDARLFNGWGNEVTDLATGWMCVDNNSYDYSYANGYFTKLADYKLLSLIQKDGDDTFGDVTGRHELMEDDLFQAGDKFTFSDYSHFLSKQGTAKTKMDNGETFPYEISFLRMDENSTTIKISKI